jgi:RHS repeat-associated protein
MPGRIFQGQYRFGFNGKEQDPEPSGQGNQYDYGFRIYNPRIGRFLSVDPLTKSYPMLTPYQFASNTPIQAIDLDGLEGVQYVETMEKKDGTTVSKRVVELDVYVGITEKKLNINYKKEDLKPIESSLNKEFNNRGLSDANGLEVVFRFNIKTFDADAIKPEKFARQLSKSPENINHTPDYTTYLKGLTLTKGTPRAATGDYNSTLLWANIDIDSRNPSHTRAHEIVHAFLNYNGGKDNPSTPKEHDEKDGILFYEKRFEGGEVVEPLRELNQGNVDLILKNLPELPTKKVKEE